MRVQKTCEVHRVLSDELGLIHHLLIVIAGHCEQLKVVQSRLLKHTVDDVPQSKLATKSLEERLDLCLGVKGEAFFVLINGREADLISDAADTLHKWTHNTHLGLQLFQ